MTKAKTYSAREERMNIWSHAAGILLSGVGLIFLLLKAKGTAEIVSSLVFGLSLLLLYAASTRYHSEKNPDRRARYRILDHAAIFVLIAGTYTPFAIISLKGQIGQIVLAIIWTVAFAGIVLKVLYTGRFTILSTVLYVGMGWIGVAVVKPIMQQVPSEGVWLLGLGGLAYTVGALVYLLKKLPYNHAIFHFFVLAGSALHFFAVYGYVI